MPTLYVSQFLYFIHCHFMLNKPTCVSAFDIPILCVLSNKSIFHIDLRDLLKFIQARLFKQSSIPLYRNLTWSYILLLVKWMVGSCYTIMNLAVSLHAVIITTHTLRKWHDTKQLAASLWAIYNYNFDIKYSKRSCVGVTVILLRGDWIMGVLTPPKN